MSDVFDKLTKIVELLEKILDKISRPDPISLAETIEFYIMIDGKLTKVGNMFLKATDKVLLSLAIKDAQGNPAKVDGLPAWAVTDPALATLEVAEDGMSAMLLAAGPLGVLKVQVQADADLGEGVKTILGELDVEVIGGEAVTLELSAGEAVPQ